MKAMVLAAGLGTRLQPITFEVPKPMVPVLDRPVMAHIVDLLDGQGFDELVANLHWFPDQIRGYFGDRFTWRYEEVLLGTAGGVRGVADFFGDEDIVVVSGDALTDLDLRALVERHHEAGGIATLSVKRVPDTREFGVVIHDADGRIQGFQEKPDPAEALSDLANCGIYCFSPEIFDYFPAADPVDWADDVFPVLLENDVPFHVHEIDAYWNDVGSIEELRQGTIDALEGRLRIEIPGERREDGVIVGEGAELGRLEALDAPVWVGAGARIDDGVRLMGPVAIGDRCRVGRGASLRDAVVFPGTEVDDEALVIGGILGHAGIVDSLRPAGG
jgi:mannose-1-phosphate guanylyltransferase/mannose-1-phosphate guanylyltransferase/phosphomannomutase